MVVDVLVAVLVVVEVVVVVLVEVAVVVLVEVDVDVSVPVVVVVDVVILVVVVVVVVVVAVVVVAVVVVVVLSSRRTGAASTPLTSTTNFSVTIAASTKSAAASFFNVTSIMTLPQVAVTSRTSSRAMPVADTTPSIVDSLTASRSALKQSAYSTKLTTVGFIVVVVVTVVVCREGHVLHIS